jgi:hypothetical protein
MVSQSLVGLVLLRSSKGVGVVERELELPEGAGAVKVICIALEISDGIETQLKDNTKYSPTTGAMVPVLTTIRNAERRSIKQEPKR